MNAFRNSFVNLVGNCHTGSRYKVSVVIIIMMFLTILIKLYM
jgi:hypothetical protein